MKEQLINVVKTGVKVGAVGYVAIRVVAVLFVAETVVTLPFKYRKFKKELSKVEDKNES